MILLITSYRCPDRKCRFFYDMTFYKICTGLGPETLICPRCEKPFRTHRTEWSNMTSIRKIRFLIFSAVAAGLGALALAMLLRSLLRNWAGYADGPTLLASDALFYGLFFTCLLLLLALQGLRVSYSIDRSRAGGAPIRATSIFKPHLDYGLQPKLLGPVSLIWLFTLGIKALLT